MSARQQFAAEVGQMRTAAGLSLAKLGAAAHVERSYIHNIIGGRRWPSRAVAHALDAALGARVRPILSKVPNGRLVQMWDRGRAEPSGRGRAGSDRAAGGRHHDVELRLWRADAGNKMALRSAMFEPDTLDRPLLDWMIGDCSVPVPAQRSGPRVTDQDVALAADMLATFRKLDHAYGAGQLRTRVVAFLATEINDLLTRRSVNRTVEVELMTVAAGLCEMLGYQAVDIGADGLAGRYYLAALGFTHAAGDRAHGAHLVAANIAHLALHAGRPHDALRMVRIAQHGIRTATSPAARVATHAVEARVYARLGREQDCTSALLNAETMLSRADPADEPAWMRYFTPADLEDEIAHCMYDLGQHDQAQRIARAAVQDLDPSRVRRLAIDTALLAQSLAGAGEVEEACAVARDAVEYASRTHSLRTTHRIGEMRRGLSRFAGQRDVADLEAMINDRTRSGLLPAVLAE